MADTFRAVINLFKEYGFRDNRNKNRLHFLLEAVGMEEFVKAIKEFTKLKYEPSGEILSNKEYILEDSGVFELGENLKAVHFSIPSGIFKGSDLIKIGHLCDAVSGKIRLSVEQSVYIITDDEHVDIIKNSEAFKKLCTI